MSFLSPWFLLGLLGVGIPLAIHLSRREKAEKVVFSTIRFLKRTPKKMILFQQIQQWLLLLTRAAVIALLAVAFARPFITGTLSQTAGLSPRSVVILLDTSMSMAYGDTFERAKKAVLIATDAISEGINLQHAAAQVVHYELPWNPNRLEQRNGRVDRVVTRIERVDDARSDLAGTPVGPRHKSNVIDPRRPIAKNFRRLIGRPVVDDYPQRRRLRLIRDGLEGSNHVLCLVTARADQTVSTT